MIAADLSSCNYFSSAAAGQCSPSKKASGWMQVVLLFRDENKNSTFPHHFYLLHHGRVNTELSKIHQDLEKSLLMKK